MIKQIVLGMLLAGCLFLTGVEACECADNWTDECEKQFQKSINDECKHIKCGEIELIYAKK